MEKLTQKWAIISLLEEIPEGSLFHYSDFPLHVTLAGVFKLDISGDEIAHEIQDVVKDVSSFAIEGGEKAMFGPEKNIAVTKVKESPELQGLYTLLHNHLVSLGAVYNSPEFEGDGHIAHSTFQKSGRLSEGETRHITSISLIDLFPNSDGYQRKIHKTIALK